MVSIKTLGLLLIGVFIGAVTVEILNKRKPKLMKKVRGQANKAVEASEKSIAKVREQANKVVEATEKSIANVKNNFVEGFTETSKPKSAS